MPFPAYMWLKDSEGNEVQGSVKIAGREGSVEIQEFNHELITPKDPLTSKVVGPRRHSPVTLIKEYDASSPYLYKFCKDGATLQSVEIIWYTVDNTGTEQEYFKHLLEDCKISSVKAIMHNTKDPHYKDEGHREEVAISYSKITWTYVDGAITASDSWTDK